MHCSACVARATDTNRFEETKFHVLGNISGHLESPSPLGKCNFG